MAARAPATSLPRGSHARPAVLNRPLRRWLAAELQQLRPAVAASAAACAAERYRKHFGAYAHACLLLFHGLTGLPSLRQSYAAFADCPGLVALSGLAGRIGGAEGPSVSFSQLAASNTTRPAAFLGGLLPALLARIRQAGAGGARALPPELHLLDSTFLRLSLKLAPWLPGPGGPDVPGLRLQVQYAPALDLPERVLLTDTRTNDCRGWDALLLDEPARLASLRDQTLVMDLGYYSHRRFAHLRQAGVHFVSRLHEQAHLAITADRPIQAPLLEVGPERIRVLQDQQVSLGSPTNRAGAVLPGLRLVTAEVAPRRAAARAGARVQRYRVLTDRWDLAAAEVIHLYLWRWLIELFFRWLKRHVRLPRLLGYSRNAVELTVWLALLVHLLSLLAAQALGLARRSAAVLRRLASVLAQLGPSDLRATAPPARQLPLPGWPIPSSTCHAG